MTDGHPCQSASVILKIRSSPKSSQLPPFSKQCNYWYATFGQNPSTGSEDNARKRSYGDADSDADRICTKNYMFGGDIIKIRTNILSVLLLVQTASMVASRQQKSSDKSKTLTYHIILRGSKFWTVLNGPCCDDLRHVVHSNFLRHSLTKSHQAKVDVRLINGHLGSLKLKSNNN